ncbi:Putative flavin-containing monoamine oxidase AofH [Mycobacterium simulans]|uniref:Flavin-containing monoamine oxidase AofH n=1 Tax=Mycobacterium simulans TaxID=627089 RepID=A0A7Z7IHG9_9MYCO|nr:NAD(P)/FAD-dependent oxidoreductase [Mycobacterium simulans]SOJ53551.1 Putative flavin-containing monoamine oxidase AofH [Mycobacterium simulans]
MTYDVDVAVVGAGLSGLTTGYRLVRNGIDKIVVLEAKDRVGGRTLTTKVNGTILDAGATIISPAQQDILALADELGTRVTRSHHNRYVYLWQGERRIMRGVPQWATTPAVAGPWMRLLSGAAKLTRWQTPVMEIVGSITKLERLRRTVPPLEPWLATDATHLDAQSLQEWINRETAAGRGRQLLEYLFASYFSPKPTCVSLLYALHVLNTWGGLVGLFAAQSNTLRFDGGAQSLSLALADRLGERVRLGSAVRVVAEIDTGYSVQTQTDEFRANHVVVAVPPKNAIEFRPELPDGRRLLLDGWESVSALKINVVYAEPFWRRQKLAGAVSDLRAAPAVIDTSPGDGKGVLSSYVVVAPPDTPLGNEPTYYTDSTTRKEAVLSALEQQFGPQARDFEAYHETNWADVPFQGGCEGGLRPGVLTTARTTMATPVGGIHWAGVESAQRWAGWMNGAVEAGGRAAAEVLDAMRSR